MRQREANCTLTKSGLESFRLQVKLGVSSLTIKHAWLVASTDSLWLSGACYSNWIYTQKLQYVHLPVAFVSIWTGWKLWSFALVHLWCFSLNTFLFWKRTKNNVSVLAVMRATMAREILLWVFHSNFRAFSCIFQTPYWADHLWSGHQGRDRFILHKIPILVTSEVENRPRLVTAGYGWHGSQWVKSEVFSRKTLERVYIT